MVHHVDRFYLPGIAQVEYRLGNHQLMTTSALTPIDGFRTKMYAVVSFRFGWLAPLLRPFVTPLALKVVNQDVEMLRSMQENINRFGGEDYANTEVDVLSSSILRLLRRAAKDQLSLSYQPAQPQAVIRSKMSV